jgi:hypothetical protein
MRSIPFASALLAATFALAGTARAVEPLTGTYQEKIHCVGEFNGEKWKASSKDALWYLDDLGDGNLYLHDPGGSGWKYHGWLEVDSTKTDQGIIGFADCGVGSFYPQGEVRVLRVKTSPGKLKIVLRGTGLSFRDFGAAICSHTFTRISEQIGAVNSTCP